MLKLLESTFQIVLLYQAFIYTDCVYILCARYLQAVPCYLLKLIKENMVIDVGFRFASCLLLSVLLCCLWFQRGSNPLGSMYLDGLTVIYLGSVYLYLLQFHCTEVRLPMNARYMLPCECSLHAYTQYPAGLSSLIFGAYISVMNNNVSSNALKLYTFNFMSSIYCCCYKSQTQDSASSCEVFLCSSNLGIWWHTHTHILCFLLWFPQDCAVLCEIAIRRSRM